jgi:predicted nucleotidyltransferase
MDRDVLYFGRAFKEVRDAFSAAELKFFSDLVGQLGVLYGRRMQSVKLVGSRARGDARDDSDYDFLVFLDECDYGIEVPKLKELGRQLNLRHGLGPLSLSPLSREQFLGLDAKYDGITGNFRRDAVTLWPESG